MTANADGQSNAATETPTQPTRTTSLTVGVWLLLLVTTLQYVTEQSPTVRDAVWGWLPLLEVSADAEAEDEQPIRVEVINRSLDVEVTNRRGFGTNAGIPVEIVGPTERCQGLGFDRCVLVTVP